MPSEQRDEKLNKGRVVSALIEALNDEVKNVQWAAIESLGRVGRESTDAVCVLMTRLEKEGACYSSWSVIEALRDAGGTAVPFLVAALKHVRASVRRSAAAVLAQGSWPELQDLSVVLTDLLSDESIEVRRSAAWALGCFGQKAEGLIPGVIGAVPGLIAMLKEEDASLREAAAEALGQIGPDAQPAVPALVEVLITEKEIHRVRRSCEDALRLIGDAAVPVLVTALKGDDALAREGAARALCGAAYRCMLTGGQAHREVQNQAYVADTERPNRPGLGMEHVIPTLVELLKDESLPVREAAADSLGWAARALAERAESGIRVPTSVAGKEANPVQMEWAETEATTRAHAEAVICALVGALRDESPVVRLSAVGALCDSGPCAASALSAILTALNDPHRNVRLGAVEAIGAIGRSAGAAVPVLVQLSRSGDEQVQDFAFRALGRIGSEALEPLLEAVESDEWRIRTLALAALCDIGPNVAKLEKVFTTALSDEDWRVRFTALCRLHKMSFEARAALPALIDLLHDDENPNECGIERLEEVLGGIGLPALKPLLGVLRTESEVAPHVRGRAAAALSKMGKPAVPALIEAVNDANATVRACAIWALGWIAIYTKRTIGLSAEGLKESGEHLREKADHALERVGLGKAIPALLLAGRDDNENVRKESATALGEIGLSAENVVPALSAALRDESASVRVDAAAALGCFGGEARLAVTELLEALKDQDSDVRSFAARFLAEISI